MLWIILCCVYMIVLCVFGVSGMKMMLVVFGVRLVSIGKCLFSVVVCSMLLIVL